MSDFANNPLRTPKPKRQSKRQKQRLALRAPESLYIDALTHDGRGIATYGDGERAGKKVFVAHALPHETVLCQINAQKNNFEMGDAIQITNPSPARQTPPCTHFGVCGGCSLQHMHPKAQIEFKQSVLDELFAHHAHTKPDSYLAPIVGDSLHYRTKARLGVRYVAKKQTVLAGFRERGSNFLAQIDNCPILDTRFGAHLMAVRECLHSLHAKDEIAQLELAMGQVLPDVADSSWSVAVIVRHLAPLDTHDTDILKAFFANKKWQLYLQPHGADSVARLPTGAAGEPLPATSLQVPPTGGLFYRALGVTFEFSPQDFTQVNFAVNEKMLAQALDLLNLQKGERVLDLFCGLGNFSLVMAKAVGDTGQVIGVEGSQQMTMRATANACANHLTNCTFYAQDLTQDFSHLPLFEHGFDALLIDPPRSGAAEVMAYLPKFGARRIVYVSCNPITLARDSALLSAQGYRLVKAGVMDMFCHTAHVESMALFEKIAD